MVQLRVRYFEAKLKKTLAIVTAIAMLLLVALVVIPKLIDINNYKSEISSLLAEQTGLEFDIKGDISLTILPDLGMALHDIKVSGSLYPDSIESTTVQIDEFSLRLKLIPLLKGKLEFDTITLKHPVVTVLLAKNGDASKKTKIPEGDAVKNNENADTKEGLKEQKEIHVPEIAKNNEVVSEHSTMLKTSEQALAIEELRIYQGEIEIKNPNSGTSIRLKDIDTRAALSATQAPFSSKAILVDANQKEHTITVEGGLVLGDKQYVAEKFLAQFDDIRGYGKIDIDLRPAIPDVKILLNVERLILDPYLDASSTNQVLKNEEQLVAKGVPFKWSQDPVSFTVLKKVNAHINISVGAIRYKEVKFKDVASNTHIGHGRLTSELKTGIVEGQVTSKLSIDATNSIPTLEHMLTIEQLDLTTIPENWNLHRKLSGTLNASLGFNSTGHSMADWINHLSGEGILNIMQGKIKGIDLRSMTKNVASAFQGVGKEDAVTEFDKIHASFSVAQGVIENDDLAIEIDPLRFSGQGKINLPEMVVDYRLVSKMELSGSKDDNMMLPILIKGSLFHPQFAPDIASSVVDLIKDPGKGGRLMNTLKDNLKGTQGTIKKDLKQELKNLIPKGF